jgi:hypothetical protein
MADSARHATYQIVESTYGTTPTSPAFVYFRSTGNTLGVSKTNIESEELYADRGKRDSRHGNKNLAGDIPTELSYGSHDTQLEAALGGSWSTGSVSVTALTISATASGNTIDDSGSGFGSFAVGDMILISGFTGEASNNGVARVTAASAASLTVDGLTLTDDAAGESVTIKEMDQLLAGTTRRSFSILRDFSELTNGRYQLNTGSEFNTVNYTAGLDAIVTVTYGVIGKGSTSSASAPASSTFGAATTTEPMVPTDGCVTENGAESAIITTLDWSLDNGMEAKFNLCSDETAQPGQGMSNATGNITAYFDNDTLLNKFLNETESSLKQVLTDAAGNTFAVFFPKIKYNGGQPDVGGEANSPISLPFEPAA